MNCSEGQGRMLSLPFPITCSAVAGYHGAAGRHLRLQDDGQPLCGAGDHVREQRRALCALLQSDDGGYQ